MMNAGTRELKLRKRKLKLARIKVSSVSFKVSLSLMVEDSLSWSQ